MVKVTRGTQGNGGHRRVGGLLCTTAAAFGMMKVH
jgi:hypothetical protein